MDTRTADRPLKVEGGARSFSLMRLSMVAGFGKVGGFFDLFEGQKNKPVQSLGSQVNILITGVAQWRALAFLLRLV